MHLTLRRGERHVLFAAALVGLLALLAGLQWRWLDRVSRAERQRLRSNLQAGADGFAEVFDRDLTRAFDGFQIEPGSAEERPGRLAEAAGAWRRAALHPRLLRAIFLAERDLDGSMGLRRLAENGTFEKSDWPAELRSLKDRLERRPERGSKPGEPPRPPAPFADEVPALVVPIARSETFERPRLEACAILEIDLPFVTKDLFPELSGRFFPASSGVEGRLVVIRKDEPDRVLFRSDPLVPIDRLADADVRSDLFSLRDRNEPRVRRPSEEGLLHRASGPPRRREPRGADPSGDGPDRSPREFDPRPRERDADQRPGPSNERDSERPPHREREPERPLQLEREGERPFPRPEAGPRERGGRWQLLVTHRAGSLEKAVAGLRRQDLAMSLGIFVLLGLAGTMLVVSARRAERLAHQQIEFVAGVSHELRTPIAAMRSAGQNLADGVVTDPEGVRRYGTLVETEGRRLTEMVEKILEFSGMQSGHRVYQPRVLGALETLEVIEGALSSCRGLLEEGRVQVERDLGPHLPSVDADPEALRRVLVNLIENAVKYGGPDGHMKISARREGAFLCLAVSDRGRGVRESEKAHLFTPFFRGRDASRSSPGTGLGLSLVKEIVEAHHGRVRVDKGDSGRGSRFVVLLPAVSPRDEPGRRT